MLAAVPLPGETTVAAHGKRYPHSLGVQQRQTEYDGQRDVLCWPDSEPYCPRTRGSEGHVKLHPPAPGRRILQ